MFNCYFLFCFSLLNASLSLWGTCILGTSLVSVNVSVKPSEVRTPLFRTVLHLLNSFSVLNCQLLVMIIAPSLHMPCSNMLQNVPQINTNSFYFRAPNFSHYIIQSNTIQEKKTKREATCFVIHENITAMTHRWRTCKKGRSKQVSEEGVSSCVDLDPCTAALKSSSSLSRCRKTCSLNSTYLLMAVGEPQSDS